ncbi:serine recombinase [Virgibacillus pantothenticus]|uniref:recombinase family protein n=1 Tax=Virgibacillus pantothenticus TaxID=1473 RepID=UPI001B00DE7B|nr:recombinase family protein [Virgibacillus pantothenticus]GIP62677.1 serine recombinase [Virgibacillus pantothenticus]
MVQTATKLKVALYVRKSRDGEGNGVEETLHNQRETLIRISEQKRYSYDLFQEVESSINWNRPELAKMLEGIMQGKYSRVLVTHTDRLSRDERDSAELKEIFIENDIIIETPDSTIDLSDENQELMFGFTTVLSAYEYKRIRHRLNKGKYDAVALKNRWIGSIAPIGYTWDKITKQLLVNPDEKKIVRKMTELALLGYSSRQIADRVNELGYRSRKGIPFKTDRVLGILQNRVYLGESKYNSKRLKKTAIAKDTHEAIMTETEFNQIQALFKSRRSKENLQSLGIKSPLNKLLVCGVCSKGMTIQLNNKVRKTGRNYSFYQVRPCRHQIDLDTKCHNGGIAIYKLENAVLEALNLYKQELEQSLVSLLAEDTSDIETNLTSTLEGLKTDLAKQERKAQRLLDVYLEGDIDKSTYQQRKKTAEDTITALTNEINILRHKLNSLDASAQVDKVTGIIEMIDNFEEMELEEQNATLKLIVSGIVYTKTADTNNEPEIDIKWREL